MSRRTSQGRAIRDACGGGGGGGSVATVPRLVNFQQYSIQSPVAAI